MEVSPFWWRDKRGVDLISDALPFGRLWHSAPDDAIEYAKFYSHSHNAVIRVFDEAGNVIETLEHKGEFRIELLPRRHWTPSPTVW